MAAAAAAAGKARRSGSAQLRKEMPAGLLELRGVVYGLQGPPKTRHERRAEAKEVAGPPELAQAAASSFDLFQQEAPVSLTGVTGRARNWTPPRLRVSPTEEYWCWTGLLGRVELVAALQRAVNLRGKEPKREEIRYGVLMFELLESFMHREMWDCAYRCSVELLRRFPSLSLAYFKAGMLLLVKASLSRGRRGSDEAGEAKRSGVEAPYETPASGSNDNNNTTRNTAASPKERPASPSGPPASSKERPASPKERPASPSGRPASLVGPPASPSGQLGSPKRRDSMPGGIGQVPGSIDANTLRHAGGLLKCALQAEPANRHLAGLVDFVLRLATNVGVPSFHKYRDPALYPRSLGDAVALAVLDNAKP